MMDHITIDHTPGTSAKTEPFTSIWHTVYERLYKRIITFSMTPGARLSESRLAEELKVSRSPVKMALDELVKANLVEKRPRKGYFVSSVNPGDCLNLCEARNGIEGLAAYLAAQRISDKQIVRLGELCREFKQADQKGELINIAEVDHEFHQIIIDAAQNHYISHFYDAIKQNILRYRNYVTRMPFSVNVRIFPQHHAIYSALKTHSSLLAKDGMLIDIDIMRTMAHSFPHTGQENDRSMKILPYPS